jgi:hypothetical protein
MLGENDHAQQQDDHVWLLTEDASAAICKPVDLLLEFIALHAGVGACFVDVSTVCSRCKGQACVLLPLYASTLGLGLGVTHCMFGVSTVFSRAILGSDQFHSNH